MGMKIDGLGSNSAQNAQTIQNYMQSTDNYQCNKGGGNSSSGSDAFKKASDMARMAEQASEINDTMNGGDKNVEAMLQQITKLLETLIKMMESGSGGQQADRGDTGKAGSAEGSQKSGGANNAQRAQGGEGYSGIEDILKQIMQLLQQVMQMLGAQSQGGQGAEKSGGK